MHKYAQQQTSAKLYFDPRDGRYHKDKPVPTWRDYLLYLENAQSDGPTEKSLREMKEMVPIDILREEGYFPEGVKVTTDDIAMWPDIPGVNAFIDAYVPDKKTIQLAADGYGNVDRSAAAHEAGHSLQQFDDDYPYYSKPMDDPNLDVNYSIDSITNGPHMTDRLRSEIDAWDKAPGRYDTRMRDACLRGYMEDAAARWRWKAFAPVKWALLDFPGRPEVSEDFRQSFYKKINKPIERSGRALPSYYEHHAYDPSKYFPEVKEFWRTNSVPSAIPQLKKMMLDEYERWTSQYDDFGMGKKNSKIPQLKRL